MGNTNYTVWEDALIAVMVNNGRVKVKEMTDILNKIFPATRTSQSVELRIGRLRNPITPANRKSVAKLKEKGLVVNPKLPTNNSRKGCGQVDEHKLREEIKAEVMEEIRAELGLGQAQVTFNPQATAVKNSHQGHHPAGEVGK